MKLLWLAATVATLAPGVVIDRIAVVTGKTVIKTSDIDRNLRVIDFLNGRPIEQRPSARRAAADRLVDQEIIRQELTAEGFGRASDQDASNLQSQIVRDRFGGSVTQFRAALQRYGLSEQELHEQLMWQMTVLRFIDQRFRPGVLVTDEEVQAYYNQHLADIQKESPNDFGLAAVAAKIKALLESQRIDQEYDAWLADARQQTHIEYKDAAFQ